MKMTRKIIPAIVMLLVSAIMLSTASFAWFASNSQVTATDMTVTAKSTAKFLTISGTVNGTYSNTAEADVKTTPGGVDLIHAKIDAGDKTTVTWWTGTSNDSGSANAGQTLNSASVSENYALINDFYVKMSSGSTAPLVNLKVKEITVTGSSSLSNALRVLVVGPDGAQLYTNRGAVSGKMVLADNSNSADKLLATVPMNSVDGARIDVYAYYDGEDEDSYTDKATSLGDLNVSISFIANE